MRGLTQIPSTENLVQAYHGLLTTPSLSLVVLSSQWARFDPRLAEVWVKCVVLNWKNLDPLKVYSELQLQPWPNSLAVLLEFVAKCVSPQELDLFLAWKKLILIAAQPAHFEQFFIGQRKVGGQLMLDDATFSLKEYLKWGYLGREILFNKSANLTFTTHSYDLETRKKIAEKLVLESKRLYTKDYWNAIGKSISRRQAEKDLLAFPFLQPRGITKGRYFIKK